jgi:hypothetical protein
MRVESCSSPAFDENMPTEILIHVPAKLTSNKIIRVVDKAIIDLDLIVTIRAGLKSFPGSIHWHLKRDLQRGTLEITWWPDRRRLWLKIQAGRMALWIDKTAKQLKKKEIELRFDSLR